VIKTLGSQLAVMLRESQMRQNVRALVKYVVFVILVMLAYSALFQLLMTYEGQKHSWLAGLYWTVVTMTTLGFGDITFHTDLGRTFSMFVLLSGVVLLLVVLPFIFIRYFYAPWLEAQVRLKAPRTVKDDLRDHVIICTDDPIAPGLVEQLKISRIPYLILEPDPERAARRHSEGESVLCGAWEARETYEAAGATRARLLVANLEDVQNTNVILTVREVAPEVPIVTLASSEDSVDIMELAGADHVLPLRRQLGEQLANRINAGHAQTHVIGHFRDLVLAEFPVLNTPLAGKTVRESGLRDQMGLNIVAVWEQAALQPAHPDRVLTDHCLPVIIGTEEQMKELDELLYIYDTNWNPIIVIGGGKVGRSATRALKRKGVPVHLIERKPELAARWQDLPDRMFVGDAANRELLEEAGIADAPSVLLTTNDDSMNIYLAVYCRRLNETARIVSRITHERNMAAIRRAGADLVMSYAGLGVAAISSMARGQRIIELGEGVELFEEELPQTLNGKTLAESAIGARTGLSVVAVEREDELSTAPPASEPLTEGCRLFMIGTPEQHETFRREYGTKEK
jgi:voltage-gated potassium channel